MAETLIPPWLLPVYSTEVQRVDDMTSVFAPRFARGRAQRNVWADPRPSWSVRWEALRDYEKGIMRRAIAEARGQGITVRWCPGRILRGSWPASELLTTGSFANGTTGWTVTGTGVLTAADRTLRSNRVDASNFTAYQTAAITAVDGAAYIARAFGYVGRKATAANTGRALMGTSAGGSEHGIATGRTDSGMSTLAAVMGGTTIYFGVYDDGASKASGEYHDIAWASVSRCARVNGASQTGSALLIKNCPTSTNGLLLPGDHFEINGELKEVAAPVNSDGSGNAYVRFRPGLARTPADNDPVIFTSPMGRFLLAEAPTEVESLGTYLAVDMRLVEAYEE